MVAGDAAGSAGQGRDNARPYGEVIRVGRLSLDLERLAADSGHGPVPLTRLEFLLLRELAVHPGQPVPKGKLLATVWGYDFDPGSNVVDVCVRRLRSKFGFDLINTVRGKGYQLAGQLPRGAAAPSAAAALHPASRRPLPQNWKRGWHDSNPGASAVIAGLASGPVPVQCLAGGAAE